MITGRDIVFLSSIDWDELWQGNHEVASRLAANGNRILYIENIGVRAPRWRDRARVVARLRSWSRGLTGGGMREVASNLWVTAPLLMPPFGPAVARGLNRRLLIPAVVRAARRLGMRDPVVWTYLPTDTARDLIAGLRSPASTIIYSCLADFAERVADPEILADSERELLAECDLVFAQPGFVERCKRHSDRVLAYEPGVSTELFDPFAERPPPRELDDLRGPVVGYVGGLQRNVDLTLLRRLARERPEWTWVFVGPTYVPVDALAREPNVRLLGALPHHELPGAIAAFDVCIAPLVISAYTASMVPTKIGEYLAMGKPVVSTSIPYALELERACEEAVITADPRPVEYLAALERALVLARDERTVARCRALAAGRDWPQQLEEMSAALSASPRWERGADEREQPAQVFGTG